MHTPTILCFLPIVFLSLVSNLIASSAAANEQPSFQQDISGNSSSSAGSATSLRVVRRIACSENTFCYEFSNGLTLFVHRKLGSQTGTVRVLVRNTGSLYEGEYLGSGISHLLEHLVADGGTTTKAAADYQLAIDRMGGMANAGTSKEMTTYYINCNKESIRPALEIMADRMQNIVFLQEKFDSEKKVVLQELSDGEIQRPRVGYHLLMQTAYLTHPYRHPIIGYIDTLSRLRLEDVKKFYQTRYTPNNQIFMVAGDVDPEAIVNDMLQYYQNSIRGPELNLTFQAESPQISPRECVQELDGGTVDLYLAWSGVTLSDSDAYPLDVLATLLANGKSSRLIERVKNKQPLALSIGAASLTPQTLPGLFLIQAGVRPENLERLQSEILDELKSLKEVSVTATELERAKKKIITSFVFERQEIENVANSILQNYVLTGDPNYDASYIAGIRKVSMEDLRRVAKKYLRDDTQSRILITPKGMAPQQVGRDHALIDEQIQAIDYPNNKLKLLTKRNNRDPIVNIQVYSLASALGDNDATAGRSAILAEMLDKGSTRFKRQEIAEYFDSIGTSLNINLGRNTIYAEATVLKEDWEKSLEIVMDSLLSPELNEEEFVKAKERVAANLERRKNSSNAELMDLFAESLPTTTPYHLHFYGTKESVERLTLSEIQKFHRNYLTPANMVVTICGDLEQGAAANRLNQILSRYEGTLQAPSISFDRSNELVEKINVYRQTEKPTAQAILAWPICGQKNMPEYAALTVLQTILGGYGYPGGRLFQTLREEGLIYKFQLSSLAGPTPGYLCAQFETRPGQVGTILEHVRTAVEKIKTGELNNQELEDAKQRIIAFHANVMEPIAAQAQIAALDSLYGLGFAHDHTFNARIQNVTLEEVIAAAHRYTLQEILVVLSPQEEQ